MLWLLCAKHCCSTITTHKNGKFPSAKRESPQKNFVLFVPDNLSISSLFEHPQRRLPTFLNPTFDINKQCLVLYLSCEAAVIHILDLITNSKMNGTALPNTTCEATSLANEITKASLSFLDFTLELWCMIFAYLLDATYTPVANPQELIQRPQLCNRKGHWKYGLCRPQRPRSDRLNILQICR